MRIYLLPSGIGVSDGLIVKNSGTLELELLGETADGIVAGGKHHAVIGGKVTLQTDGLTGTVPLTAHDRPRHRAFRCDALFFVEDVIIPIAQIIPTEYITMAAVAEQSIAALSLRLSKLESAVFGLDLFGKEETK